MAYATDLEEVKLFYKTYMECIKELGLPTCEYYIYGYNI
jgi:hypothetical protein